MTNESCWKIFRSAGYRSKLMLLHDPIVMTTYISHQLFFHVKMTFVLNIQNDIIFKLQIAVKMTLSVTSWRVLLEGVSIGWKVDNTNSRMTRKCQKSWFLIVTSPTHLNCSPFPHMTAPVQSIGWIYPPVLLPMPTGKWLLFLPCFTLEMILFTKFLMILVTSGFLIFQTMEPWTW